MKPCNHWRQKLADYALDTPPSAELTEHLQKCPACSAALDKWRLRVREIDEGIRQLAVPEPSTNAVARILARVDSRNRQQRWFPSGRTVAAAFAALVILALSVEGMVTLRHRRDETQKTLSAAAYVSNWKSPTQNLLVSPYDALPKRSPRLGKYFYDLKTDNLKIEHYAPRAKEKENQ